MLPQARLQNREVGVLGPNRSSPRRSGGHLGEAKVVDQMFLDFDLDNEVAIAIFYVRRDSNSLVISSLTCRWRKMRASRDSA